jgi:twitching motility protein PilT
VSFNVSFFDLPPVIERMLLVSDNISDLNFSVGQQPQVEINGKLTPVQPLGLQRLTPYQTELIAMSLMHGNPDAAERLVQTGTADLSYSLPSRTRFASTSFAARYLLDCARDSDGCADDQIALASAAACRNRRTA